MNAIEIQKVNKTYPGFRLQDISFNVPKGSIMGLVGENGAGKSTLIKLIMKAASKDSGNIAVLGVDNESADFSEIKQDIGIVLDEAYFPESLTAEKLGKVMRHTYRHWEDELYQNFLKRLALPGDKAFKDFSRGMKMKLAIAVALSHKPKLLILDEATSGLDPMVRDEILDLFNDFTRDASHSILLSSHIVSDLEKICDYIVFIHAGKLILCEEKDRLLEEYAIVKLGVDQLEAIPEDAIKGIKKGKYGVEALVLKEKVSAAFVYEHTSLEDIILFLVKGEIK